MSARKLWFGTPGHMKQIKMPMGGGSHSAVGYTESVDYISGRKSVRRSLSSHMEYDWTWRGSRADVSHLLDCAQGMYGPGPFYFIDPVWAKENVLPAHWATPSLGAIDAPPIYGSARPESVPMVANDGTWPASGAMFRRDPSASTRQVYIPIEPGKGVYFWYAGTEGVVRLTPYTGKVAGTPIIAVPADPARALTDQLPNMVSSDGDVDGVMVSIEIPSTLSTATIYGMRAVIAPGAAIRSYTNLFTNPRLKGDGTYAEVARNLFTNPRLVGDGTWAEVRRNLCSNPSAVVNTAGWSGATRVVGAAPLGLSQHFRLVAISASQLAAFSFASTVGVKYKLELYMRSTVAARVDMRDSTGVLTAGVNKVRPDWELVTVSGTARETLSHLSVRADGAGDIDFAAVLVEISDGSRNFFDGSTMDSSMPQPEDFRVRWLGAPNASESVMEIEQVRGFTTSGCILGVSTRDGKPAARQIGTYAGNQLATIDVPLAARGGGTTIATKHQDVVFATTQNSYNTTILNPQQNTPRTNQTGSVVNRRTYTTLTYPYQMVLSTGTSEIGSGDVWWTDIGIFAGDYKGEYFHGSYSPGASTLAQPEDFRWRWVGAVDNSESVMEIERVAGVTTSSDSVAGTSTWGGRPAVRHISKLLAKPGSTYSWAYISIPTAARTSGTFLATANLLAPLTGNLSAQARTVLAAMPAGVDRQAPNVAGSHQLRAPIASLTSSFQGRFIHGGQEGSGDVWWTDIGLYEGDYDGPNFTGADPLCVWDGTPDASTSTRYEVEGLAAIQTRGFTAGRGHAGVNFEQHPNVTPYSVPYDSIGVTARLVEVDY